MIVIDYTDFPLPTQSPNSLTVRSVYFTSLMETIPTNPEDSSIISRGLAAFRPVTPGNRVRREILKESFIDVPRITRIGVSGWSLCNLWNL